jgi:putative cell wall-binding protein
VNFPDALAGAAAAGSQHAPILLVTKDSIPVPTAAELMRLKPARIVILGSAGVVSSAVAAAADEYTAGAVSRIGGADRYATAAAISAATFAPGVALAYVATGANFPDALAGAAAAGSRNAPVLLVKDDGIPSATVAELQRLKPAKIVVLGGASVVSSSVKEALAAYTTGTVIRLAGGDRYSTAATISSATFAPGVDVVYVATGANFPDALAGAAAAGSEGAPILLVTKDTVPSATAAEVRRLNPGRIVVLGSTGVVSEAVRLQLLLGG